VRRRSRLGGGCWRRLAGQFGIALAVRVVLGLDAGQVLPLDVEQFLLRLDLVVGIAQALGHLGRQGLPLVELGLILELLALLARRRDLFLGSLDRGADIQLGAGLQAVDILCGGIGLEQRLVLAPLLPGVLLEFLLALRLGGGLGLLLRGQRRRLFPDQVAVGVEDAVGLAAAALRKTVAADAPAFAAEHLAAARILAARGGCMSLQGSEQNDRAGRSFID
jgi:hypothetical protein